MRRPHELKPLRHVTAPGRCRWTFTRFCRREERRQRRLGDAGAAYGRKRRQEENLGWFSRTFAPFFGRGPAPIGRYAD